MARLDLMGIGVVVGLVCGMLLALARFRCHHQDIVSKDYLNGIIEVVRANSIVCIPITPYNENTCAGGDIQGRMKYLTLTFRYSSVLYCT